MRKSDAQPLVDAFFTEDSHDHDHDLAIRDAWFKMRETCTAEEANLALGYAVKDDPRSAGQDYDVHAAILHHLIWHFPQTFSDDLARQVAQSA